MNGVMYLPADDFFYKINSELIVFYIQGAKSEYGEEGNQMKRVGRVRDGMGYKRITYIIKCPIFQYPYKLECK